MDKAPDVSAHPSSEIHPTAAVHRSVLWENTRVEAGAQLERVVVGANVTVAAGAKHRDVMIVRREIVSETRDGQVDGDNLVVPVP